MERRGKITGSSKHHAGRAEVFHVEGPAKPNIRKGWDDLCLVLTKYTLLPCNFVRLRPMLSGEGIIPVCATTKTAWETQDLSGDDFCQAYHLPYVQKTSPNNFQASRWSLRARTMLACATLLSTPPSLSGGPELSAMPPSIARAAPPGPREQAPLVRHCAIFPSAGCRCGMP